MRRPAFLVCLTALLLTGCAHKSPGTAGTAAKTPAGFAPEVVEALRPRLADLDLADGPSVPVAEHTGFYLDSNTLVGPGIRLERPPAFDEAHDGKTWEALWDEDRRALAEALGPMPTGPACLVAGPPRTRFARAIPLAERCRSVALVVSPFDPDTAETVQAVPFPPLVADAATWVWVVDTTVWVHHRGATEQRTWPYRGDYLEELFGWLDSLGAPPGPLAYGSDTDRLSDLVWMAQDAAEHGFQLQVLTTRPDPIPPWRPTR